MNPFLKELLLITNPNVLALADYLNRTALLFILPCFYLAMVCEYLTNWNFKDVVKRSFIAFLAIKLLTPLHVSFVNESLMISSQLVKQYSPQNKFLSAYNKTKMDKKVGVWEKLSSIVEMIVTDPIVLIIFLFSYIAFFLLTQLYSLVYHLGIVLIGVCAVLSIFPMTSKSLIGAIKTSLWCILMPFVVAIVLCLIGDSDAFLKTYSGGIVQNLESLIQLLIMTVILLMTPMITSKIMSDSGVSSVAENIGQMAAMSTLIGGAGVLGAKSAMFLKATHNSTSGALLNYGKGKLSEQASSVMDKKGVGPTVSSIAGNKGIKSQLNQTGKDVQRAFTNTSFLEKTTIAADSIINRKENQLAKAIRKQDAHQVENHPQGKDDLLPLSSYKREVKDFFRKTGNNSEKVQFIKPQLKNFHSTEGGRTKYMSKPSDKGAFLYSEDKWKNLSPSLKEQVHKQYGRRNGFKGKEGYVYFPTFQGRAPMPANIYNRTLKPKTIKELRDEKSFLD